MERWLNKPLLFEKSIRDFCGLEFPHTVDKDLGNGTVVGEIKEDKLTTVQKTLLCTL